MSVFVVSDISVTVGISRLYGFARETGLPFARQIQNLGAIIPERHANTRDGIENLESANGFVRSTWIPKTKLTIAHTREASGSNAVVFTHPYSTAVLGTWVASNLHNRLFLSGIPYSKFLVAACCDQEGTGCVPGKRLDDILVLQLQWRLFGRDIPKLNGEIARGACEDIFSGRIEEHVPNFSAE